MIIFFLSFSLQLSIKTAASVNNWVFLSALLQMNLLTALLLLDWVPLNKVFLFNNSVNLSSYHLLTEFCLFISFSIFIVSITPYLSNKRSFSFEPYFFFSLAQLGLTLILGVSDLVLFFICFEIQAFSLYAIASFKKNSIHSIESTLKYFVLGALFSGFMLLGFSFVYGTFGTLNIVEISFLVKDVSYLATLSIMLVVFSFLFKLGLFPFHQ
jgi:NADH:ubiquinone oxidoreductase subunit 2 (subunit N)